MAKKRPLRKCIVSGEMKPKEDMIRIVRNKDGEVFIDETGKKNGRGAYVSLDPDKVEKAKEENLLSGILKTNIPEDFYGQLLERVQYRLARKEIMKQNE
ncbi:MAG: YlxR family protein [Atopostipes sp.]|nr:YlxR family protein [Atopostipes sp.]